MNAIGTLTVNGNATLGTPNAGAHVFMEIDKSSAAINDVLRSTNNIDFGGNGGGPGALVTVSNIGPALVAGDSFKLFDAASYSGAIGGVVLFPAQPGPALKWNPSTLPSDGTLRVAVVPQPVISSASLSGANLVISGTNGTPNLNYAILASTNVALPLASWTALVTNAFDGSGNFSYTNSVAAPKQFFRIQAL